MTNKYTLLVKLNAGNDRNGNPRRGWLVRDNGTGNDFFVDEGYQGDNALDGYDVPPYCADIATTPGQYRKLCRDLRPPV